ncbi:MAG: PHB depolymerase family esterase [Zhongshania sp.]|uniref:alpha/beta hydrolase family esterase n=1 Tax=Zhongshania sp. TaxID=1971902 RepID=UPI0026260B80|nr:PHB depolymerase family esterase [Zhongshania sp.]MDF1691864.1 PHB depolymerase family esterase [Zhongshania sp.]
MLKTKISYLSLALFIFSGLASVFYYAYSPAVSPPSELANLQQIQIQVGGLARSYSLYIPANLPSHAPLVVMLHGSLQSGDDIRMFSGYQFEQLAEQHGFALAYPFGYENNWNDCRKAASYPARNEQIDDLNFIEAITLQVHQRLSTDLNKTFIAGYSSGGQLGFRFALERPHSVAGIAAIAASLPAADNLACSESGVAVPVLIMNGTEDPINPYYGGLVSLFGIANRGHVKSAVTSAEYFAHLAGYIGGPTEIKNFKNTRANDPTSTKYYAWRDRRRPEVILYTITDGGHVIPQEVYRPMRLLGKTSVEINGPEEIWAFFARQLDKQ